MAEKEGETSVVVFSQLRTNLDLATRSRVVLSCFLPLPNLPRLDSFGGLSCTRAST
jgi:hypothetical protein